MNNKKILNKSNIILDKPIKIDRNKIHERKKRYPNIRSEIMIKQIDEDEFDGWY